MSPQTLGVYGITDGDRFATLDTDQLRRASIRWRALEPFFDVLGLCSNPTDPEAIGYAPLKDPSEYRRYCFQGLSLNQAFKPNLFLFLHFISSPPCNVSSSLAPLLVLFDHITALPFSG